MPQVVTGIAQTSDTAALQRALKAAGYSVEPLSVFSGDDAPEGHPDSGVRFVQTDSDSITDMLSRGTSGIYSSGGGRVPDLDVRGPGEYFRSETVDDELSELDIPDSELQNYEEAIDAGRAVVAYHARPDAVAAVEDIFRSSGLLNVRTF